MAESIMSSTCATYKLLTNKYDNRNGRPTLQFSSNDRTKGNDMKLAKSHVVTLDMTSGTFFHTPDSKFME